MKLPVSTPALGLAISGLLISAFCCFALVTLALTGDFQAFEPPVLEGTVAYSRGVSIGEAQFRWVAAGVLVLAVLVLLNAFCLVVVKDGLNLTQLPEDVDAVSMTSTTFGILPIMVIFSLWFPY
ncbi:MULTISPECIES: hypothetical protein [Pseudomonas]|uniref:Uncharacterized protein n=1 Tax=Pseudomonas nitroreducens TaxID=46680 RepID=A0A6G6J8R7_PSENT|nr:MULTISPECIES: hypothetical protein [Pseudomonas]MDU4254041.1 hypothetical protein [Pseudomonas sp.]QIE91597.1 hypothetical protein G5B91_35300 [Pseudomonas nitroreducens]